MSGRLIGLDVARYFAFVGMVVVNFDIIMSYGSQNNVGLIESLKSLIQGRASATFVVLAGIGLGLSNFVRDSHILNITLKRAIFLLAFGLLNMIIFPGDILHYYAFYFFFGVFFLSFSNRILILTIALINVVFCAMLLYFDYEAGWNFDELSYSGLLTIDGFIRNLFFNGFHPIFPWIGFFLLGILLSRVSLRKRQVQIKIIVGGFIAIIFAEFISFIFSKYLIPSNSDFLFLIMTESMPPMPLYFLASSGSAFFVIGLCLLVSKKLKDSAFYNFISPAGTQTLTLYILHIIIGLGFIDFFGFTNNQTSSQAFIAALIFCIFGTIFTFLWSKWFGRGIFESFMRKLTD
tara:strand:- start:277 stop:1320 length:1044 start_codon:yes stop_codon:yes gene_type:complete